MLFGGVGADGGGLWWVIVCLDESVDPLLR